MKRTLFFSVLSLLAPLVLILACLPRDGYTSESSGDPACKAATNTHSAPTLEELKNATYNGFKGHHGPVTLADGRWEGKPYVEGGASRPEVYFVRDFRLIGDVNGDGTDEAVVLLGESAKRESRRDASSWISSRPDRGMPRAAPASWPRGGGSYCPKG